MTENENESPLVYLQLQNDHEGIMSSALFLFSSLTVVHCSLSVQSSPFHYVLNATAPSGRGKTPYESHPSPFGNQEEPLFICLIT